MQLLCKIQWVKGKSEWLNGMCKVSEVTNVSLFSQLSYFIAGISQKIISRVPWPRRLGSVCSSLFVPLRLLRLSRRSQGVTRGNNELHILPEWRNKRKDVPDWWLGPQPGVRVFAHRKWRSVSDDGLPDMWYFLFCQKLPPFPLPSGGVVHSALSFLAALVQVASYASSQPTNTFTLFLALSDQRKVG